MLVAKSGRSTRDVTSIHQALKHIVTLPPDERAKVLFPHLAKEALVCTARRIDFAASGVIGMTLKWAGGNAESVKVMVEEYFVACNKCAS